jgi:predicted transcriptional regulator
MSNIAHLIEKAGQNVGSEYKLAKLLGVSTSTVSDWKCSRVPCSPGDRARLAGFAGEDAVQELVRGTIDSAKGQVRKEQLEKLLGKWLHQTGGAVVSGLLALVSAVSLMMWTPSPAHASNLYDVYYVKFLFVLPCPNCF